MPIFYFRNDDVNILDNELVQVSKRCIDEGVPITHTIEPANIQPDAVQWLKEEKARDPRLLEIMQHGYDHKKRDVGEFGGKRPFDSQLHDLKHGKEIMLETFGDDFLPAINYPFGPYNKHTIKATDQLGFRILCSHYNSRASRRAMYAVGHLLRLGQIKGKHVSYHLDYYPRTGLYCIDMATTYIKTYIGDYGSRECIFHDLEDLKARIESFIPFTPVIGVLLHHRFHTSTESLDLISRTIEWLRTIPGAEFMNLEEIYRKFSPDKDLSWR